jgi:AGZA family xanthine/uracil permease-like MFS transporter
MMMKQATEIDWEDQDMVLPAFLTMVMMPFTYSIADGIAWGVISFVIIKLMGGITDREKLNDVSPIMWGVAIFMLMFYLGPGDQSTFGWLFNSIF